MLLEFVYHTYLDMPERIQRTLSSLLGEAKIPEGEKHVDYSEAKENILYLLTSAYTDSNQLDERWTGDDFIFDFLKTHIIYNLLHTSRFHRKDIPFILQVQRR